MISHDIKTVMTDATHVLHVGKNVFYGTKEEYLTSSIGKNLLISEVCIMSEIISKLQFYFQYVFVWYALIVGILAIG